MPSLPYSAIAHRVFVPDDAAEAIDAARAVFLRRHDLDAVGSADAASLPCSGSKRCGMIFVA